MKVTIFPQLVLLFGTLSFVFLTLNLTAQDLSEGLVINDLSSHPMQDIAKPDYLESITDPAFGTTIRRITNGGDNSVIVPMYSTIQAWNSDESLMILYDQSASTHQLIHGETYEFIRYLDDIAPADIEQIFWDFNAPDNFYYLENQSYDFIKYTVSTQAKETIVNVASLTGCTGGISMGNDVQMMSWDSDFFTFRCENSSTYAYQISTNKLTEFNIDAIGYAAAATAPSGQRYYHKQKVYNSSGQLDIQLNEANTEHSCMGKLSNGNDAHFAIAFAQGPNGGCIGDIVAHDLTTGDCYTLTSQEQGYNYSQSGTHISALAHKNTEGGWIAASMIGYDQDGQSLLDQELVIVKADQGNIKVCRIGHHRSDEDDYDYWGEPHAVISPKGTRVLFGSDWSGAEDGNSVDSYVVELPSYENPTTSHAALAIESKLGFSMFPNPASEILNLRNKADKDGIWRVNILNTLGQSIRQYKMEFDAGVDQQVDLGGIPVGMFYVTGHSADGDEMFTLRGYRQ